MPRGKPGPDARSMSQIEAAYLAGIIDGEGCIHVRMHGRSMRMALGISMTHRPTIEWILATTGCGYIAAVSGSARQNPSHRRAWGWYANSYKAADVLRQVLPFLVTKADQAKVFIGLMDLRERVSGSRSKGAIPRNRRGSPIYDLAPAEYDEAMRVIRESKKREFA